MNLKAPKIDPRRFSQLLAQLKRLVPHYTPEWQVSDEKDPGVALLKIFAHMAEDIIERLNRTPHKNFVAFLNMLGIKLLPARPARVPLTFTLAEGTETEILIKRRTRTVAQIPDDPGELPFETENNLLATPSTLKAVYSVDPAADAIYRPPPGFLDRNLPATAQISYKINAFSPAASNTFQLDHDSGLEIGDFLKIMPEDGVEQHVVISEIEGTIVQITGQLSRNYSPDTRVEKNNEFFLFENVNLQEHILYLGHSDLFSVKSESCFTLEIKHLPGTPAVLQSLPSSWEYWGDVEGREEEAWRKFYVKADGNRDLSQNGEMRLIKGEGEIKEREINGITNRWIRCKLIKPPSPELPQLDCITFRVESTGKPVHADQAFHNDTPLDVALPFFPFGSQPRMYDKFYLASKEVFSKRGAQIKIDVKLDLRGILASPAAVVVENENGPEIKVFARGTGGRLIELELDPVESKLTNVIDHDFPPDTTIDLPVPGTTEAAPSVVSEESCIWVFVKAENGHLVERFYDGKDWAWIDHNMPEKDVKVHYDPSAVHLTTNSVKVYVVGENGKLYALDRNQTPTMIGEWKAQGESKDPPALDSAPYAVNDGNDGRVFVKAIDGNLWELKKGKWSKYDSPPSKSSDATPSKIKIKDHSRPFAQLYKAGNNLHAKVFIVDNEGNLWELDTKAKENKDNNGNIGELDTKAKENGDGWTNHGSPDGGKIKVESNPHGFIQFPDHATDQEIKHIFVRCDDGKLWEKTDCKWVPHHSPPNIRLEYSPFVVYLAGKFSLYIYSGSNKNSIIEKRIIADTARNGNNATITLDDQASDEDNIYKNWTIGIIKENENEDIQQPRKITDYKGDTKVATVSVNWEAGDTPAEGSKYRIWQEGTTIAAAGQRITLSSEASGKDDAYKGFMIGIINEKEDEYEDIHQPREITDYNGKEKIATVGEEWDVDDTPEEGSKYRMWQKGNAKAAAGPTITLSSKASSRKDAYKELTIEIIDKKGKIQQSRKITAYNGETKVATANKNWEPNVPGEGSKYRIIPDAAQQRWSNYEDPSETSIRTELSWEYWDGNGWVVFKKEHGFEDHTKDLLIDGNIEFKLPQDIKPTDVSGQECIWIRARIVGGDYGAETYTVETFSKQVADKEKGANSTKNPDKKKKTITKLIPTKSTIRPPRITKLTISYELTKGQLPQKCLTFNNLDYRDQTAACTRQDTYFDPFLGLEDRQKTIYFGFEKKIKGAPIKVFLDAKEIAFSDEHKPQMVWRYRNEDGWPLLSSKDQSEALIKAENLELLLPEDFFALSRFGRYLYWIKGTLAEGNWDKLPVLRGIYPNTTWAFQVETVLDEILGSSSGDEKQEFRFSKFPVREGEKIRVREALTGEEKDELTDRFGKDVIRESPDESGRPVYWVSWREVETFAGSGSDSRHYKLDRATGELQFGDGKNGMIPPAGVDNIRAFSYQAVGGFAGNVEAGKIQNLASAIAGVDSVVNPAPSGGGSDAATLADMLEIGPAKIGHRHRAVTLEDFEWLAREASREVAKVRCLANTNNNKQREAGWVSVYIVPDSQDATPRPSLELRRTVLRYLQSRCAGTLADQNHIFVGAPEYVEVKVSVDIYVTSMDVTSQTERLVRQRLETFFHPLRGGPAGKGWEFGRNIAASDVYVILEETEGVDHVEKLKFTYNGKTDTEIVKVGADSLVASGKHTIKMRLAARA